ncbi:MAG: YjgN family protein [Betaproteobacteria bacterium]
MNDTTPAAAAADPWGTPSTAPAVHELPLRFVGSGSEYFRIWIVNLLLTLVTLGLYYPFAKVRRLRYFHGATEVGGAPLSFHADPWKMFRGYVLVALMLAAYTGAGQFSATAGAVAFLIVAALWPALWHSSMRFRLANTGWRGLRFRYTGTRGGAYAVMAVPLGVAMLFVLGALLTQPEAPPVPPSGEEVPPSASELFAALAPGVVMLALLPLFFWLLKRLQHSNYALGPERTGFTARVGSFYGLAFTAGFVGIAAMFGIGILAAIVVSALRSLGIGGIAWLSVVAMVLGYLVVFSLVGGYWTARLQNLTWGHTASARLRFKSSLPAHALARLWFKNLLLVLLTLGLYFPFAQVATARLRLEAMTVVSDVDPDEFAASAAQADEAAAGDAAGDLLGFDIGL